MSKRFGKTGGLTTEDYGRMDLGNLAIKRNVVTQTDNAISDYAKKNPDTFGKAFRSPFSVVNEEMIKDYQIKHKIDETAFRSSTKKPHHLIYCHLLSWKKAPPKKN